MNDQLYQIIQALADGAYHTGKSIGQQHDITRSAVWKYMKQLPEKEIVLASSRSQGYRIPGGLSLLDEHTIATHLDAITRARLCDIHVVPETTSTTQHVLTVGNHPGQPGTVCFAEYQTQGKGRRERSWRAPFASGLLCSLTWRFHAGFSALAGLSLMTGLSLYQALKKASIGEGLGVKWPNDLVYRGKKVAGVLTEFRGEGYGETQVVISFGINIAVPHHFMADATFPWTDVAHMIASPPDRNTLAAQVLNQLVTNLVKFEQHGFGAFLADWRTADATLGKSVKLLGLDQETYGVVEGITPLGELLIRLEHGQVQAFHFGEISLRNTQGGYV